jgi:hypothetical protein
VIGRWHKGEAEVEALIQAGSLERLLGAQADGEPWLAKAARTLETAQSIGPDDPESAYVLGYDAARHAAAGLLAHQGLRATSKGGHYAIDQTMRFQFGSGLGHFGALRRRRNELEYPAFPGERVEASELHAALLDVAAIVRTAGQLLAQLGLF